MRLVIWGGVLLLLPGLLYLFLFVMLRPHPKEPRSTGLALSGPELLAWLLAALVGGTRGWALLGPWTVGLFLLASGIAEVNHFSSALTPLCEGSAAVVSLLTLIGWYAFPKNTHTPPGALQTPLSPALPPVFTASSAPPALLLHTPYYCGTLTLSIHAFRKRQSCRLLPNRFEPGGTMPPETWFVELDYTMTNSGSETSCWGQLEEVLPDDGKPHLPRTLRQFPLILKENERNDIAPGSSLALTHAKYTIAVKDTLEGTMFFKLGAFMNRQKMVFSLYLSPTQSGFYEPHAPLFTIDV